MIRKTLLTFLLLSLSSVSSVFATDSSFESILLPILTPPVKGAFGSEFHTHFRLHNRSSENGIVIEGLRDCFPCPIFAFIIDPNQERDDVLMEGTPGLFITVRRDEANFLSFNLRVYDVTRGALNFGTEIPVVREHEFATDQLVLLGVPTDSRFRTTLRIYSRGETQLLVTFSNGEETVQRLVTLQRMNGGGGYATIGDFPTFASGAEEIRVMLEPLPTLNPLPQPPFWGFISVTNNETQAITTITPQR